MSPAQAALVTWTFSGTSGGSPYTASVTYDSLTPPSSLGSYDSAIVSAAFQSGSYAPEISVAAPNLSFIGLGGSGISFFAGAPNGLESPQNPRFQLLLGDLSFVDQSHLPIAPPNAGFPAGASFNLYTGGGADVFDAFPISSIGYAVPEPGFSALVFAAALTLVLRRTGIVT